MHLQLKSHLPCICAVAEEAYLPHAAADGEDMLGHEAVGAAAKPACQPYGWVTEQLLKQLHYPWHVQVAAAGTPCCAAMQPLPCTPATARLACQLCLAQPEYESLAPPHHLPAMRPLPAIHVQLHMSNCGVRNNHCKLQPVLDRV